MQWGLAQALEKRLRVFVFFFVIVCLCGYFTSIPFILLQNHKHLKKKKKSVEEGINYYENTEVQNILIRKG